MTYNPVAKLIGTFIFSFSLLGCLEGEDTNEDTLDSEVSFSEMTDVFIQEQQLDSGLSFKSERVHFVDSSDNGNILFRGNMPLSSTDLTASFEYDSLLTRLEEVTSEITDVEFPDNPYIVNIALTNNITEAAQLDIQEEFWDANPEKGEFIHIPLYGAITRPKDVPQDLIPLEEIEGLVQFGDLKGLVNTIEDQLAQTDRTVLIYVHCMAGADRTGAAIASYKMHHLDYSYNEAITEAEDLISRDISPFSKNSIQWYAYYLDESGISTNIGEID